MTVLAAHRRRRWTAGIRRRQEHLGHSHGRRTAAVSQVQLQRRRQTEAHRTEHRAEARRHRRRTVTPTPPPMEKAFCRAIVAVVTTTLSVATGYAQTGDVLRPAAPCSAVRTRVRASGEKLNLTVDLGESYDQNVTVRSGDAVFSPFQTSGLYTMFTPALDFAARAGEHVQLAVTGGIQRPALRPASRDDRHQPRGRSRFDGKPLAQDDAFFQPRLHLRTGTPVWVVRWVGGAGHRRGRPSCLELCA